MTHDNAVPTADAELREYVHQVLRLYFEHVDSLLVARVADELAGLVERQVTHKRQRTAC